MGGSYDAWDNMKFKFLMAFTTTILSLILLGFDDLMHEF